MHLCNKGEDDMAHLHFYIIT